MSTKVSTAHIKAIVNFSPDASEDIGRDRTAAALLSDKWTKFRTFSMHTMLLTWPWDKKTIGVKADGTGPALPIRRFGNPVLQTFKVAHQTYPMDFLIFGAMLKHCACALRKKLELGSFKAGNRCCCYFILSRKISS